jgi:DNA-binding IclR family transcriptional regulator
LPIGERKILTACAQYPEGVTREQLTVLTGYKRSSRDAYIQRLREKGFVDLGGAELVATVAGVAALGDFEPLPVGDSLREFWLAKLPIGERAILEQLVASYPQGVDRKALSESTGYQRSSRDAYLQRMNAKRLIQIVGRGEVKAADELFG